jgi:hypothetical protein
LLSGLVNNRERIFKNPLVDKDAYIKSLPNALNYKTGDQLMKGEKETVLASKEIDQLLPENPEDEPERYALYCEARRRMRESGLDKFCSFWCIDGIVQNKPVPPSIKACVKRMNELIARTPGKHLTTHIAFVDKHMTIWGNTCIIRMTTTYCGKAIINARIPFLAAGLLNTFDMTRVGQPSLHIQLCGPPEAGKTFPLLGFIKACFIEGTWEVIHSASERAFNSDTHIGPRIALCDEPPKWVTRKEAEDANYAKVQEMKESLISKKHTRTVLEICEFNGQSVRLSRNIQTDDATCWAYCTNQPRDKNHPLGTRMFQVTVPLPTKPVEEYQFDPRAVFSSDVAVFFNIDQILTVSVYCAIRTGAIPDVDMSMPKTVLKRVYKILRERNVIDKKKGNRSLEILETFIRHQTIIRAVTATYHVPGGPLYKKPYDPAQVHMVGPRLFPTLEIVFAVLHLMASEIIDEEVPIVWKALCKMAGYDMNKSALDNYNVDRPDMFKRELNHQHVNNNNNNNRRGGGGGGEGEFGNGDDPDRFKVNLNYLRFPGTLEQIAIRLEEHCKPALSSTQIIDVLKMMRNRQLHTKDGRVYKTVEQSKLHAYASGLDVADEMGLPMRPAEFKARWIHKQENYIVVCDYHDGGQHGSKQLFIAPEILDVFDINILDEAFYLATMCATFPRIKAIRGVVYEDYPDLFEVANWSDGWIKNYVARLDQLAGSHELKRSEGCADPTRERMTETEQDMLLSIQLNPARQNHEEDMFKVLEARSRDFRKVIDWDLEAAKRAAFRCGVPMNRDTVFWTDDKIKEAYDKYCEVNALEHALPSGKTNYPHSVINERKRVEARIEPVYNQMKASSAQLRMELPASFTAASHARNLVVPQRRTTSDRLVRLAARDAPMQTTDEVIPTPHRSESRFRSLLQHLDEN